MLSLSAFAETCGGASRSLQAGPWRRNENSSNGESIFRTKLNLSNLSIWSGKSQAGPTQASKSPFQWKPRETMRSVMPCTAMGDPVPCRRPHDHGAAQMCGVRWLLLQGLITVGFIRIQVLLTSPNPLIIIVAFENFFLILRGF